MDKAEAIKILKDFHDKSALFSIRTALETLHPELKESEDKEIREQIVYAINKLNVPGSEKNKLLAWLEKQGEQKPWSEEDERIIHNIDAAIRHGVVFPIDELKSMKIWLESLKYRIRPKHEWKKDEKTFQLIEDVIDVYRKTQGSVIGGVHTEELKDYLKSLKPQNTWKPSDEQMKVLQKCIEAYNEVTFPTEVRVLSSLYNDLKKLKG